MAAGHEVWDRIREKKAELDGSRPLSAASLAALTAWYDAELTYTSNAIEGNTLTRSETAIVLEKGITVGGKPLKDHIEALGHRDALDYVRTLAKRDEPVREGDIREIHRLVVARSQPDIAGRYSEHQRFIQGSPFALPPAWEVPSLMSGFGQWLSATTAANGTISPETSFTAHERLVSIHPFADGNGRTARLLMNLLLFKAGYPPLVIEPELRVAYFDSLQAVQVGGNREQYSAFMADRLEASLDRHLRVMEREAFPGPADARSRTL